MGNLTAKGIQTALEKATSSLVKCSCINGTVIYTSAFEAELIKQGADEKLAKNIAQDVDLMDSPKADGQFFPWKLANKNTGSDSADVYMQAVAEEKKEDREDKANYLQHLDTDKLVCSLSEQLYQKWVDKAAKPAEQCGIPSAIDDYKKSRLVFSEFRDGYIKAIKMQEYADIYKDNFDKSSMPVRSLFKIAGMQEPFDSDMRSYINSRVTEPVIVIAAVYSNAEDRQKFSDMVIKLQEKFGTANIKSGRDPAHPHIEINKAAFQQLFAEISKNGY